MFHHRYWKILLLIATATLQLGGCSIIPHDCRSASVLPLATGEPRKFKVDLASKCNRSGIFLEKDVSYWFKIDAIGLLEDGSIVCSPPGYKDIGSDCCEPISFEGYLATELPSYLKIILGLAAPFRPMNDKRSRWLETIGYIDGNEGSYFSLVNHNSGDRAYRSSTAGELLVLVNDFPWFGRYANNHGTLLVTVHRYKSL